MVPPRNSRASRRARRRGASPARSAVAVLVDLLHVRGEALEAARPAVVVRIARRDRLEYRLMQREARLAALLGEADGERGLVAQLPRLVFPCPGAGDALRRRD